MKLELDHHENIAILNVSGEVDARQGEILLAGVKRLLRDGKNKILLVMKEVKSIDPDALRELAVLNITAKELSGRIAIVHRQSDDTFANFSSPPVIDLFHERDEATEFLKNYVQEADQQDDDYIPALKEKIFERDKKIRALEKQLEIVSAENVAGLREENARLKKQNEILQTRTFDMIGENRLPRDAESLKLKIKALERSVRQYELELKK